MDLLYLSKFPFTIKKTTLKILRGCGYISDNCILIQNTVINTLVISYLFLTK